MNAPSSALIVDSVTGVEVELAVAGPGARSFAFIIDWNIRAILAIAWFCIGMMIYNGDITDITPPLEADGLWIALIGVPPSAIYLLYHPVLEIAMRGRTPGKRMAGVRLVTRSGGAPLFGAYLIRNVFRLVDQFPVCYGLGLVMTMITRNHVRIGDLAAGTLLVYDRGEAGLLEHVRNPKLDAATAEIVNDLLVRWEHLDAASRRHLARRVLGESASGDSTKLRSQLEQLASGIAA
jgi:uncharacterized RDD family membrane protein YckC